MDVFNKKVKVADVPNYQLLGTFPWKRRKKSLNWHFPLRNSFLALLNHHVNVNIITINQKKKSYLILFVLSGLLRNILALHFTLNQQKCAQKLHA